MAYSNGGPPNTPSSPNRDSKKNEYLTSSRFKEDRESFDRLISNLRQAFEGSDDQQKRGEEFDEAVRWVRETMNLNDLIQIGGDVSPISAIGTNARVTVDTYIHQDSETGFLDNQEASYYRNLNRNVNNIPIGQVVVKSIQQQEIPQIKLDSLYVPLDCTQTNKTTGRAEETLTRVPVLSVMNSKKKKRFILLGDPGSGKTTFLDYLTLALTGALLNPAERRFLERLDVKNKKGVRASAWDRVKVWKPLRIDLRDLADNIPANAQRGSAAYFTSYLKKHFDTIAKSGLEKRFQQYLNNGECVVMFDGLDEVYSGVSNGGQPADKARILRETIELAIKYLGDNIYIITCRTLSYANKSLQLKDFTEIKLAPLSRDSIKEFINKWYSILSQEGRVSIREGYQKAQALIRKSHGSLFEIAKNPMLLTVMALIHTFRDSLPKYKVQLYSESIDLLLFYWNRNKIGETDQGDLLICDALGLEYNQIMSALCEIAYIAHADEGRASSKGKSSSRISEKLLIDTFAQYMGGKSEQAYTKAKEFVSYVEMHAGLLIGKGKNQEGEFIYAFAHRGFQEYLAALHILSELDVGNKIVSLSERGNFWYEVVMLAIGQLVKTTPIEAKVVIDIINKILPRNTVNLKDSDWRKIWWAGEMLYLLTPPLAQKDQNVGKNLASKTPEMLKHLITTDKLAPSERARAADVLGLLSDDRPGIKNHIPVEGRDMVRFEGGRIRIGTDKEGSSTTVQIKPFYVSRYPVTNAQFRAFTAFKSRGKVVYKIRDFWTRAGQEWIDKAEKGMGGYVKNPSWGIDNRPICGITWYEALAYTRWLSLTTGEKYRLLTEAEWEYVANGGKARPYPWGDRKNTRQIMANTRLSGIGETCAVGIFQGDRTAEGVYDLGGNVFEWTSTLKRPLPYKGNDGRENLEAAGERVLKGGCYGLPDSNASLTYQRQALDPYIQMPMIGFRIAKDAK